MKKVGIVSAVTLGLLVLFFLLDKSHLFEFIAKGVVNIHSSFATTFFKIISEIHDFKFVVVIAAVLFIYSVVKKDIPNVIRIAVAIVILGALVFIMKKLFAVDRPDIMQLVPETSGSFPSGHASSAVVLYGLLYFTIIKNKFSQHESKYFIFAVVMCLIAGFARIYLGVHWLPDILAGYLIGFYAIFIANYAGIKLRKKGEELWPL